jgi:hypothetical protein
MFENMYLIAVIVARISSFGQNENKFQKVPAQFEISLFFTEVI